MTDGSRAAPSDVARTRRRRRPRRYAIPAALALAAGTWAARALELAPGAILVAALLLTAPAAAAFLMRRRRCTAAAVLALVALCGALNFATRAAGPHPREVGRMLGLTPDRPALAILTGRVVESSTSTRPGSVSQRLILKVESVGPPGKSRPAAGRVRVSLWGYPPPDQPRAGERVRLPLLLSVPDDRRDPGGLDFRDYSAARGTWTSGSGRGDLFEKLPGGAPRPRAVLNRLRAHLAGVIRREMPEREGPLLNTILLGWRGEMDPEDELAFTRTGAGHLLAVSGIHVMLLVGAVWWLLRTLGLRPRPAALLLVIFALAYAQLAGGRTPVIRATTMACLLLGGILLGREADGPNSLAAAAVLILAVWPRELFSVGFQMSFAAVLFIMGAVPVLEDAAAGLRRFPVKLSTDAGLRTRSRVARWLRLSAFSSLAATAGTMPLVVGTFGVICPWAPLVNMFAIPAAGASLAGGLALLAIGAPLPVLARVPAALCWGALRALETIVELARELPGSAVNANSPPPALVGAYYVTAGLLLWSRAIPDRWRARAAVLALALAVPVSLSGIILPASAPRGLRVSLPANVRGRTALLEAPDGESCVVWAGGTGREIPDMLRAERLRSPSAALVTADHREVVSGAARLLSSGRAGELIVPAGEALSTQLDAVAANAGRMGPGWEKQLGSVKLLALGAGPYTRSDGRTAPRPLMIFAERDGHGILFADLSNGYTVSAAAREVERRRLRADVVVLPFTWRAARDSARLLRASGAKVALVHLSDYQQSDRAGQALLKLLRSCGIRPLTTADHGALRAVLKDGRIRTECFDGRNWLPLTAAKAPAGDG